VEYGISGEVSRSVHGHPTGRKTNYFFSFLFKKKKISWAKVIKARREKKRGNVLAYNYIQLLSGS
jgi:hypothetical protein